MNVQAELPDHPKYLRLRKAVGDRAMEYLIRLWAHCQNNQRGEFWAGADAEYVELIARWDGPAGVLFQKLAAPFNGRAGWIVPTPEGVEVHDWQSQNQRLRAAWNNGRQGGRKPNAPVASPIGIPTENPRDTHTGSVIAANDKNDKNDKKGVQGEHSLPSDSEIPSEKEVIDFGQGPDGIPTEYCRDYHRWRTNNRLWLNARSELLLWRKDLRERWVKARASWRPQKTADGTENSDLAARLQTETEPDKRRQIREQMKGQP